jgi:hypothetical protein
MTMKPLVVRAGRWQGRTLRIFVWAEFLVIGSVLYFGFIWVTISLFSILKRDFFPDLTDAMGRSIAWFLGLMLVLEVMRRYRPYLLALKRD